MSDAPKVTFLTFKQHASKRSMWIGGSEVSEHIAWVLTKGSDGELSFQRKRIDISDALPHCVNEIITNACDQYIKSILVSKDRGGPVTMIKVWFDRKTGEVTVYNNGAGMPVYKVTKEDAGEATDMIDKWSVQGICTREYSGSNFDDAGDPDRVVGGINGLGLKLVILNTLKTEVETVDWIRKKYYHQVYTNRMSTIDEPTVVDLSSQTASRKLTDMQKTPHTTIRFVPDYANLCKKSREEPDPNWFNEANATAFESTIILRLYQIAAFISCINYRYDGDKRIEYKNKAKIYFNDSEIKVSSLDSFIRMFGIKESVSIALESDGTQEYDKLIRFPWYICIGANTGTLNKNGTKSYQFQQISLVNGLYLEKGGTHTAMLCTKLFKALESRMEAMVKEAKMTVTDAMKTTLKNLIFMVDCRNIPIPSLVGQTKDAIKIGVKDLNKMKKLYDFPEEFLDKVWNMLKVRFQYMCLQKEDKKNRKKNQHIRKYERALQYGPNSWLCVLEGDSAETTLADIIAHKATPIKKKNWGTYNIQGVPPNVLKNLTTIEIDGEFKVMLAATLGDNEAFRGLINATGLDPDEDYFYQGDYETDDPETFSEEDQIRRARGDAAYKKLNYGHILICTDQDFDGIGQICSLILVFVLVFWPELVKRRAIHRLATPLVRVYCPGKDAEVKNFYSLKELNDWANSKFGGLDNIPSNYEVNYYKGLAGHTPEEVIDDIGMNIMENIYTFTYDEATEIRMQAMYGKSTKERKVALLDRTVKEYNIDLMAEQVIPCSDHFDIEAKTFQLDFMRRKLKSSIDGMIPSQRKAFAGARIMFNKAKKAKVYQVTGYVTKKMHYQHGDGPMNETIIKMAQSFTGANNIPMMISISNGFGGRRKGRGITGSPRYIDTKYNSKAMDLIFPREDDWLLEYEYEDGQQCEPKYYVPVIPYSILETSTTTGPGWKIDVWARDFKWVIYNLRQMIKFNYPDPAGKPYSMLGKPWLRPGMRVVIGKYKSGATVSEICLGEWSYNSQTGVMKITQLPLKVWSHNLRCLIKGLDPDTEKTERKVDGVLTPLAKKDLVTGCIDNTGNDVNDITIKIPPENYQKICEVYQNECMDPLEAYLEINQQMAPHLNMIDAENNIKEYQTYEEVMEDWFLKRKGLYIERLEREKILLKLRIRYYEEMLRFIGMDAQSNKAINIDDLEEEERVRILEGATPPFVKFNKGLLMQPKYTKSADLEKFILDPAYGASYKYIDDITISNKSKRGIAKLQEELDKLRQALEDTEQTTWQGVWNREIDEIEKVVEQGVKTKWLFGAKKHKFSRKNKKLE
jgi:DNA topoisomerase-2